MPTRGSLGAERERERPPDLPRLFPVLVFGTWRAANLSGRAGDLVAAALAVPRALRVHPHGARRAREVGRKRSSAGMLRLGEARAERSHGRGAWRRVSTTMQRTPGTRVAFCDVRSWIDGYLRIHRRPPATQRHVQLRAHVAMLTRELIAQECDTVILEGLRDLFQAPKMGLKPARGARQGSAYELAVTAVHDQLAALRRRAPNREMPALEAPPIMESCHQHSVRHGDPSRPTGRLGRVSRSSCVGSFE